MSWEALLFRRLPSPPADRVVRQEVLPVVDAGDEAGLAATLAACAGTELIPFRYFFRYLWD